MTAPPDDVGPHPKPPARRRAASGWARAGLVAAAALGVVVLFAPLVSQQSTTSDGVTVIRAVSLWQTQPAVALTIAVVVGLAELPVLVRRSPHRRSITGMVAALLGVLTLLGILSIGIFVGPVFLLVLIAAIRD